METNCCRMDKFVSYITLSYVHSVDMSPANLVENAQSCYFLTKYDIVQ